MSSEYFVLLIIETAKMKEQPPISWDRFMHLGIKKRVSHIKHFDLVVRYIGGFMLCNCWGSFVVRSDEKIFCEREKIFKRLRELPKRIFFVGWVETFSCVSQSFPWKTFRLWENFLFFHQNFCFFSWTFSSFRQTFKNYLKLVEFQNFLFFHQ